MEKNNSIDFETIEREFARVIEAGLNELGERSKELSWFCTIEEQQSEDNETKAA